jgi:hypothetical protein
MEILKIPNYKSYIGKTIFDWEIVQCDDGGQVYAIVLKKESLERVFFIRKTLIKGSSLRLENDVYELWYKDFEDNKLLTLSEILDVDIVLSKIGELLNKYSKYE